MVASNAKAEPIFAVSFIFGTLIGPVKHAIGSAAMLAKAWFSKIQTYPHVKTFVANIIALPATTLSDPIIAQTAAGLSKPSLDAAHGACVLFAALALKQSVSDAVIIHAGLTNEDEATIRFIYFKRERVLAFPWHDKFSGRVRPRILFGPGHAPRKVW